MVNYPKFSDFAEEVKPFDGDKKRIDTILNQAILVVDFKIKKKQAKTGFIICYHSIQNRRCYLHRFYWIGCFN